ncbi:alcohol dehydrogenase class III [Aphelenchoides avenae]|nr:alcohol dehydrogenase class III [Aphelenchus avenae]
MSTEAKSIKCRAAVAWAPGQPLTIEEIEVQPPKEGEVRIHVHYAALCHTDILCWSGESPGGMFPDFPMVLGHEGAGVVESVGPGVLHLQPGDKVIPTFIAQCRKCAVCKRDDWNWCEANVTTHASGKLADGTTRFSCAGQPLNHFMGCSTFSEYAVCAAVNVTKIPDDAPLDLMCLLGCGISTGYGAAVKSAAVKNGSRCAVWGVGAVGLGTVLGCKDAGASQIVAIDLHKSRLEMASKLGATECIDPSDIPQHADFVQYLRDQYEGGFDYTFDCTGNVKAMRQALESAHKGWGVSCVLGAAPHGQEISTTPMMLLAGRRWIGSAFGGLKPQDDLPGLVKRHLEGKLPLKVFVTHRVQLEEINKAFGWLHSGESIKTVLRLAPEAED